MAKVVFFYRSDGGEANLNKGFPQPTTQIWTVATCRNSSRVNCMCVLQPIPWDPVNHPCSVQYRGDCLGPITLVGGHYLEIQT
jgi:hypothetical protein